MYIDYFVFLVGKLNIKLKKLIGRMKKFILKVIEDNLLTYSIFKL
ncbi:hypothetical protein CLJU_c04140 [Clostridium ljungdahlii DSM 13528]|uniref:Uncharacterized protein n=1 Tax=Clostridium ljungdahlii (strain ATCC 55383 / DSM 13528 / PETC) TaxID=748727 RepID=D8GM86_CLOLD|nr:hypothetical protein CLJU_c04140 [Clostridium ljungdahlii DSM 13528]